ncbi:MAG: glycosyltransferase [Pseudobutyrivibrio ruminis]|nr:glycosyltransferase [Pseudobutyrivibrio ruminis]
MEKYISVIVPVYNAEKYLRECIESIVNQYENFSDFELILVDDGSTDKSLSICKEYEYLDYVRVFSQKNGGPSLARNNGLSKAEGKYILYVDSDDYIAENSFRGIVESCERQKEPDILFLNGYKVYSDGRLVAIEEDYDEEKLKSSSRKKIFEYLGSRNKFHASPCMKMIKKSFLVDNNLQFEVGKRDEDIDWSMKCYLVGRTYGCYNSMYYYYRQDISTSNSTTFQDNSYWDWREIIDKWVKMSQMNEYQDITSPLLQMACYEYIILLVNCRNYIKADLKWHKDMNMLLDYKNDKMTKLVRICTRTIGIKNTSRLLNLYLQIR